MKKNTKVKLGVLFFFAILLFSWQEFTTRRVAADEMVQLATSVSFLEGNGFNCLSAEDFQQVHTQKVLSWPYFYRIGAVPYLFLTGKNVEKSFLLFEITAFAFLLITIWFFINTIKLPHRETVLAMFFLFAAILTTPMKHGGCSDMFALGASLLALTFLVRHFRQESGSKNIILFFIIVALMNQIRYAYVSVNMAFVCLYVVAVIFNKKSFKTWHLILLLLPLVSLLQTVLNPYFLSTSDRLTSAGNGYTTAEHAIWWLKPFYAPFFNTFFPDTIIVSFGLKFPGLWEKIAIVVFAFFAVFSVVIVVYIFFFFFRNSLAFKTWFSPSKLHETGLLVLVFSSLILHVIINLNKGYTHSQILSQDILYEKLAVYNRYFAPVHLGTYLLAILYIIYYKSGFFKIVIFASVLFGITHFLYLRSVYHPFNREANMNIVNNPAGSYNDAVAIGNIIKAEKENRKVYFMFEITRTREQGNFRQVTPTLFALANSAISLSPDADLSTANMEKESVFYSCFNDQNTLQNNGWKIVYPGKVYSLWKYTKK